MDNQPQVCKNDSTMLPESEVVFRAVSPHGHVYWEIDPTRSQTMDAARLQRCTTLVTQTLKL